MMQNRSMLKLRESARDDNNQSMLLMKIVNFHSNGKAIQRVTFSRRKQMLTLNFKSLIV